MVEPLTDLQKESRLSGRQVASFIVALAVSAVCFYIGVVLALPYAPTAVESYEIIPNVVCPGDETELRTALDVAEPVLGVVTLFSADSAWVNSVTLVRIGIPVTSFPFADPPFNGRYGHHDNISPIKRFAPNEPGLWYLETTLTTHGKQAGHLAKDTAPGIVSNTVRVRDFDEPECRVTYNG